MKELKLCLTVDFWLPWMIGYGCGWGCHWFDFGPFTLWWSTDTTSLAYEIAIILYRTVNKHFGSIVACNVDTAYFMLTGESAWCCTDTQRGKSP